MKLKHTLILFFILIMVISFASAAKIYAPKLNVTLVNQDPDPVNPGEELELRFRVHNDEVNTDAKDVRVRIEPVFPFSVLPGYVSEVSLGDLPGTKLSNEMVTVKFDIKVDEDAIEGDIPLKLSYTHNGLPWITQEIDIRIQTIDANLGIVSVESEPEEILPGQMTKFDITFRNLADSTMRDVSFKLDLGYSDLLDTSTAITPTESINAFNSLPFAPVGSSTEQKLHILKRGEEHTFTYNIMTYPDAESKIYKVPVIITYYDELGTKYEKNEILGLVVGGEPEVYGIVDETEIYIGKKIGNVVVRFVNRGVTDARFVNVRLVETDAYEVVSTDEAYLGDVDSDDYESAEFDIYLKKTARDPVDLNFEMIYKGPDNEEFTKNVNVSLKPRDARKLGEAGSPLGILVLLALVGGGIYFYRKRKKIRIKLKKKGK